MKRVKKVLAILGVVILVALYLTTLVSAIFATPATKDFFKASLLATIMIPILLYVYLLICRLVTGKVDEDDLERKELSENKKGFEEAFHSKKGERNGEE